MSDLEEKDDASGASSKRKSKGDDKKTAKVDKILKDSTKLAI